MMTVSDFVMLLVEDDEAQVRLTQQSFAQANLVNPLRVLSRAEPAIDYLSGNGAYQDRNAHPLPSLLLIDVDLREGHSLRLLDWLAGQAALKPLPVILLRSAATDPLRLERARERSGSVVSFKPFDLESLLRMMQGLGMYWMILNKCPAAAERPRSPDTGFSPGRQQDTEILGDRISFQKTSWDLVRSARNSEAMDGLIRIYWKPLYFFIRRKGYDNETAKDLVQDFLTATLERDTLSKADPARGRFRTFLLAALSNFIKDWNRTSARLKRGGGHALLSLDFEGGEQEYSVERATEQTPEALFDRAWAQALLAQCISNLKGKPSHLQAFELLMQGASYDEICRATGLNESAAKTAVHRLRQQLRNLLLATIGSSLENGEETEPVLAEFASTLLPAPGG